MPIEGPLRELDIHDVFQLLDLGRKTGVLHVVSELRDDEGVVFFDGGRVVHAEIRSRPSAVDTQGLSERELERKLRQQIENTVFDLMSWREGFFSFEELDGTDVPGDGRVAVPTESLLMESARRIDEWSRIADRVPNLNVVPTLAPVSGNEQESRLDLLPHEWEVLTMIDGARDLRAIAAALKRTEFEVAKVTYGLASTGVIELRQRSGGAGNGAASRRASGDAAAQLEFAFAAVRSGNLTAARSSLEHCLELDPAGSGGERARAALAALNQLIGAMEPRDE